MQQTYQEYPFSQEGSERLPSLDFPPPQDFTVLPLRAAINHSHKPAQSGLRISWQDLRAMEGAATEEGGERSNICLRPILSFLPPITTSNLCFSLRFHRIFPYQLQTRGGRKWKKKRKPKETKSNGSCIRAGDWFLRRTFSSPFLPVHVHFSDHLSAVAEVDNEEGENVYIPTSPFIVHSQLRSQGGVEGGGGSGGQKKIPGMKIS